MGNYNSGNTALALSPYPAKAADYGVWMAKNWDWQLFVTLTFRDPEPLLRRRITNPNVGIGKAEGELKRWWKASIRERAHKSFGMFTMEPHADRLTPHFHGLIGGLPPGVVRDALWGRISRDPSAEYLWREWFVDRGRAKIEPVDSATPAAVYVAKYMLKGLGKLYALGSLGDGYRPDVDLMG